MMHDETASDGSEISQPHGRYWLVGLALLGLVLALLGGAFMLDRQLRPRVDVQPVAALAGGEVAAAEAPTRISPTPSPWSTAPAAGASPSSDPDPRLVQEIEDAYRRYWDVYSAALFDLETSRLADVAAADELRRMQDEVEDLKRRNRAARVVITHSFLVLDVTPTEATVYDELRDSSFYIDPVTKEPPQAGDPRHLVKDIFHLKRVDGVWMVIKHLRQEG
jgi:hypothetical protein